MSTFDEYRDAKKRESDERRDVENLERRSGSQRWEEFQSFLHGKAAGMKIGQRVLKMSKHELVLGRNMAAKFDVVTQVLGYSRPNTYRVIFCNTSDTGFLKSHNFDVWEISLKRLPDGEWGWAIKDGEVLSDEDLGLAVVRHLESLVEKHGDKDFRYGG